MRSAFRSLVGRLSDIETGRDRTLSYTRSSNAGLIDWMLTHLPASMQPQIQDSFWQAGRYYYGMGPSVQETRVVMGEEAYVESPGRPSLASTHTQRRSYHSQRHTQSRHTASSSEYVLRVRVPSVRSVPPPSTSTLQQRTLDSTYYYPTHDRRADAERSTPHDSLYRAMALQSSLALPGIPAYPTGATTPASSLQQYPGLSRSAALPSSSTSASSSSSF